MALSWTSWCIVRLLSTVYLAIVTTTVAAVIIAVSKYYDLLCSVLTSDKPSKSWIRYSNWTSWIVFHVLLVAEAAHPHQRSPLCCCTAGQFLVWMPARPGAFRTPEILGTRDCCLVCSIGNPALHGSDCKMFHFEESDIFNCLQMWVKNQRAIIVCKTKRQASLNETT